MQLMKKNLVFVLILAMFTLSTAYAKKHKHTKKHKPSHHRKSISKKQKARKACVKDYRGISGEELNKCIDIRSKPQ
jgi:hypothetical protein